MKKFIAISILALSSVAAFAQSAPFKEPASTFLQKLRSGDGVTYWVSLGYAEAVIVHDQKVCLPNSVSTGTLVSQIADAIAFRISAKPSLGAQQLTPEEEFAILSVDVEDIYPAPCK
jgi:hypothetical protein